MRYAEALKSPAAGRTRGAGATPAGPAARRNGPVEELIAGYCARDDLATYDPYDIWKTRIGFHVKNLYNCHRTVGLFPAALLTSYDTWMNNRRRRFYCRQEYPIVRAQAALALLNLYRITRDRQHLSGAGRHLRWLQDHRCAGYRGACWGLGFDYPVKKHLIYDRNTPFSTVTPYALEAFCRHASVADTDEYADTIRSIHTFLEDDLKVMWETEHHLATSYAARHDRVAFNSVAYTMYSYALLRDYLDAAARDRAAGKIRKLYACLRDNQNPDGSWFYCPEGQSFIDCFHSCFVLKNMVKTNALVPLAGCAPIVEKGYGYLRRVFRDGRTGLFRRFSVANKPGVVKFDLYDNAELLNLALLLQDRPFARELAHDIARHFVRLPQGIYSKIDCLDRRRDLNTLRWAVMPYLHALSELLVQETR